MVPAMPRRAAAAVSARIEAERRLQEMLHRFRHPEKHQADAHPRGEKHGEPRPPGVVGPGIRATQAHAADGRYDQQQAEEHEEVPRAHEQPVERRHEPRAQRNENGRRPGLESQYPRDERNDGEARDGRRPDCGMSRPKNWTLSCPSL